MKTIDIKVGDKVRILNYSPLKGGDSQEVQTSVCIFTELFL